jgi:hypothetical protein
VELERDRQLTWVYSRSSGAAVNNVSSATARIYKFQEAMGAPIVCALGLMSRSSLASSRWLVYMAYRG